MTEMPRILVTGATGTHGGVGAHLVKRLTSSGFPVRALVRAADGRAMQLRKAGAEVVVGDFFQLSSLRAAFEGVERAFFCFPLAAGLLQATANLCVAARRASVGAVVNVSIMMAADDHPSPVCRDHWLSERILDWAGVGAIHLRGGFFYENLIRFAADGVARENRIMLPFGDGEARLAWVGAIDIARIAAAILAGPAEHIGKTYEVTSDVTLSISEAARLMSESLNRRIEYADIPLSSWLASVESAIGDNTQLRQHVTILARAFSSGRVIGRTNDLVRQMTNEPPQDFSRFVRENAGAFGR